nr:hypothetical protein [Halomonas elongata]
MSPLIATMLASWFNHVRRRWRGYLTLCATLLLVLFPVLPSNEPGRTCRT